MNGRQRQLNKDKKEVVVVVVEEKKEGIVGEQNSKACNMKQAVSALNKNDPCPSPILHTHTNLLSSLLHPLTRGGARLGLRGL